MDKDGYPEEAELEKIKNWDVTNRMRTLELLDYIKDRWQYADCGYYEVKGKRVLRLRLSTAGWSGNESIIEALKQNRVFWIAFWQKSERGGHYWFRIPLDFKI